MPTKRILMRQIKEILRLKYDSKLSHKKIASACGVSKGAVGKYINLAKAKGLTWPLPEDMDEQQLESCLFRTDAAPSLFTPPDYPQMHQELKRKGVTLQLLWAEYSENHQEKAYQYSQFCHHYRQWAGQQKRSMRQVHRAGEKLFIDYCGPTIPIVSRETGEMRTAQVFVAVMGASSFTYADATWTQTLPDWIASHQRAFQFFGGVTELLVPDNLKAGVSLACRYEPVPNATYQDMAQHYKTAILPARPYKPQDKAKAEAGVLLVERWILARLRHHTFFSLAELNRTIADLLDDLNRRPFQKLPGSRLSAFESLDKPALKSLPEQPYDYAVWKKATVGIDYHIEADKHYYSVPHQLVGKKLDIRISATLIEVLYRGNRIASHMKSSCGGFTTLSEHMPKRHQQHLEWSPERFIRWGRSIGPCTAQVIVHVLQGRAHPEQGYRACLGLLNHARRYSKKRLEAACERALAIHSPNYRSITSILKNGLDQHSLESTQDNETENTLPEHNNVRGSDYYH